MLNPPMLKGVSGCLLRLQPSGCREIGGGGTNLLGSWQKTMNKNQERTQCIKRLRSIVFGLISGEACQIQHMSPDGDESVTVSWNRGLGWARGSCQ